MCEESEIGLLISNIIEENRYSHCRLCFGFIGDGEGARFNDEVACSPSEESIPLEILLSRIFGEEVTNEIPALDAVCNICLKKAVDIYSFIQQYKLSTIKLYNILDNLNASLSVDIEPDQVMYITCSEQESKLILMRKESKEQKIHTNVVHKCKDCKQMFYNLEDLLEHYQVQHNLFMCKKCMYTSTEENDVTLHEVSTEFYQCEHCSLCVCTKNSLEEHVESIHSVHVCLVCGKSYKGLDKFRAHEEKHIVKNDCPKCGKSYVTKDFYERHVKLCLENNIDPHPMRNKMEKNFICKECGKGYKTSGGLRVHERFVHGNAQPHVCTECGKKFTAPCLLKAHQVTHTKEKNFPCDLCDGRFVTKEALLYHRRRHTGEKPYPCNQCSESFVNASARADHIKFKHIGPTLSCEYCTKKFVTKIILRNHMKKHHDPLNKLYMGRADVPHNVEGNPNMQLAEV